MKSITSRLVLTGLCLVFPLLAQAWDQGIYLTQYTFENTNRLNELIKKGKEVGINTFVVDIERIDKKYDQNMALLKTNNIKYVARVTMFPGGGTEEQVRNPAYWEKKNKLAQHAIDLGASAIQLDYIRYNTHRGTSPRYTEDVHRVVKYFKEQVAARHVPLQMDVFGETCFAPSKHIGQDLTVLADTIDSVNPMVYPSHYWPYQEHSAKPYETIADSLDALSDQFDDHIPFKVHAFIEASNYHYHWGAATMQAYIAKELKAVEDSGVTEGWYAWSAHNQYDNLFAALAAHKGHKESQKQEVALGAGL